MRDQVYDALRCEARWLSAAQLAERHNLPVKAVSQYLSKLATYGQIGRIKLKHHQVLYSINKKLDMRLEAASRLPQSDYDAHLAKWKLFMRGTMPKTEYVASLPKLVEALGE